LQDFLDRYEGKRDGKLPTAPSPNSTGVAIKRDGKEKDGGQVFMESTEFANTSRPSSREDADRQAAKLEQSLNLAHAYANLGRLYTQKSDFERALENYEKGLKINQHDPYLHKLRSENRIKRGDVQGAIEDLNVVVNSRMGGFASNLDRGLLLLLQGKDAEAEKAFALHVQTYPASREYVTKTVEEAKKLRSQQTQQ
jgi:tetratricopeptide (TPR) repeat protein